MNVVLGCGWSIGKCSTNLVLTKVLIHQSLHLINFSGMSLADALDSCIIHSVYLSSHVLDQSFLLLLHCHVNLDHTNSTHQHGHPMICRCMYSCTLSSLSENSSYFEDAHGHLTLTTSIRPVRAASRDQVSGTAVLGVFLVMTLHKGISLT